MMKIPFYQIDAFTSQAFAGNPAGVCLLDDWLSDDILQSIAMENNLPETAFLVQRESHYDLRWFTPAVEIDLCGHATLAGGYVILEYIGHDSECVEFTSKSGRLSVEKKNNMLFLDFPSRRPKECDPPEGIDKILGSSPSQVLSSRDLLVVFDDERVIRNMSPDLNAIAKLDHLALIATAPGNNSDFVSRFFAPRVGIPEDPVTGSAHCTLIPYWSERLNKTELHAFQLSKRGGELFCVDKVDRVSIGGKAVTYMSGTIEI